MILKSIQTRSKLFFILFSLVLLLPTRTSVNACSDGSEEEELRYMLFNPNLIADKSWWAYFYNAKLTYLDGAVAGKGDEDFLTHEWMDYMGKEADPEEAWACLFSSLSDSALQRNSFYKVLATKPAAKSYFEIARKCEQLAGIPLPWDEDAAVERVRDQRRREMIHELGNLLNTESDPFIKRKLAFQSLKLSYYANMDKTFNVVYNTYFNNKPSNVLDWWAMHYKSMTLEKEDTADSANYYHALVYSNSSNKMYASRQWFSRERIGNVLALARNDHEKAAVLVLAEAINPGRSLGNLKKIAELDPNHKHLPLLVAREINKLEDWLGTTRYAHTYASTREPSEDYEANIKNDRVYLSEVREGIRNMSNIKKSYPEFYALAMAYLSLMDGDYKEASDFLVTIKPTTPEIDFQVIVLRLVLIAESKNITNPETQDKIGTLFAKLIAQREGKFESQKVLYSLSLYLRTACEKKGMIHLAGLFDNYAVNKFCLTCDYSSFEYSLIRYFDKNASPAAIEKLIALYDNPHKNKLEALLLKPYSNKYFFYDVLSVKYLREGNLKSASNALKQIPDDFWFTYQNAMENIDRDPFLENDDLLTGQGITVYNKREILEKMVKLEENALRNPTSRATNYFQLGNAWYNFSQHTWFMISYVFTTGETGDPAHGERAKHRALGFYQKALAYEQSDEKRAQLLYMITLLTSDKDERRFAREYEQLKNTAFYVKRNCLTTKDLAN